jgi:hypothetical protein
VRRETLRLPERLPWIATSLQEAVAFDTVPEALATIHRDSGWTVGITSLSHESARRDAARSVDMPQ